MKETLLFGMFLCDILNLEASYNVLGAATTFNPAMWRWKSRVNFVMLYGPGALRLAFCAGVGLGKDGKME